MKSESIEKICKRYKKEWLLILVDKIDEARTLPLEGRLLAHSLRRDDIYEKQATDRRELLICYGDDPLPKGHGYVL